MAIRILTWNLQGRARPDLAGVVAELEAGRPDVVLLQEVQRRQARVLAASLGWQVAWRYKHWPLVVPAEGLAVLAPARPRTVQRRVLAHRWGLWSSNRRIAVAATVTTADGPVRVVDTHLGSGIPEAERAAQAALVASMVGADGVVAGDLNATPGSPTVEVFDRSGFRDAWAEIGDGPGHTNWRDRPRTEAPVQRLDYVLVGPGWRVVSAGVPSHGDPGFERWGRLSDHLPVTVTLERT
jgi:endonuclease/exonuclease/phosphatase family metal-dependent hydrolase